MKWNIAFAIKLSSDRCVPTIWPPITNFIQDTFLNEPGKMMGKIQSSLHLQQAYSDFFFGGKVSPKWRVLFQEPHRIHGTFVYSYTYISGIFNINHSCIGKCTIMPLRIPDLSRSSRIVGRNIPSPELEYQGNPGFLGHIWMSIRVFRR